MHYIRFLKPPRFEQRPGSGAGPAILSAKITVTTDLGEAFLAVDIGLMVELELDDGDGGGRIVDTPGIKYVWKGSNGMRALEVSIRVPSSKGKQAGRVLKMLVRPNDAHCAVNTFADVLGKTYGEEEGGVVAVRSMDVYSQNNGIGMAERVFTKGSGGEKTEVCIWEETGESIARHIWDAGLVLSAYFATSSYKNARLPLLQQTLEGNNLNVLELGAGCGIVGITLSQFSAPNLTSIILTDLPEADDILSQNLLLSTLPTPMVHPSRPNHQVLDWSAPLSPDIVATKWDMVLVADCTYNPDVVPDLVQTLMAIAESSVGVLVCLAMKVRHESEMVFFDLMSNSGWKAREKMKVDLPVLGNEGQEIEVFVFGVGAETSRV